MSNLLLGIDIGTYSSKGVLVQPDGTVLKASVVDHEMSIPHPGWAEQDADSIWWGDLVKICAQLLDGDPYRGEDVGGVAVSAIGACMLPMDEEGKPLRPGILYGVDTRASREIEFLNQKYGEEIKVGAVEAADIHPAVLHRPEPAGGQSLETDPCRTDGEFLCGPAGEIPQAFQVKGMPVESESVITPGNNLT